MNFLLILLISIVSVAIFIIIMRFIICKIEKKIESFVVMMILILIIAILSIAIFFMPFVIIGREHGIQRLDIKPYKKVKVVYVYKDTYNNTTEITLLVYNPYSVSLKYVSTKDDEMGKVFKDNLDKKVDITITPWFAAPSKEGRSNNIVETVEPSKSNKKE